MDCELHKSPKFYDNVFLYVGDFGEFWKFDSFIVSKRSDHYLESTKG